MEGEDHMIYSRRYHVEEEAKELLAEMPEQTDEDRAKAKEAFAELMRSIREESVFIMRLNRIAGVDRLIELAKHLSEQHEIDTDIIQHTGRITVHLYMGCFLWFSDFIQDFTALLEMCDLFSLFMPEDKPGRVVCSLDYITHDHYVSGRKVSP